MEVCFLGCFGVVVWRPYEDCDPIPPEGFEVDPEDSDFSDDDDLERYQSGSGGMPSAPAMAASADDHDTSIAFVGHPEEIRGAVKRSVWDNILNPLTTRGFWGN